MKIENIIERICPICKEKEIISFRKEQKHTNGYWNEYITFKCGLTLHFSPNYMTVIREGQCENDSKVKERERKKQILLKKIVDIINESDLDKKIKEDLISNIKWNISRFIQPPFPE